MMFSSTSKKSLKVFFVSLMSLGLPSLVVADSSAGLQKISLTSKQEEVIDLSKFKGKIVYVDIWASWCGPCRNTLPWLSDLQARYGNENFQVVAINVDTEKEDAEEFLEYLSEEVIVRFDPKGIIPSALELQAMPSSFLLDSQGNIELMFHGFVDSSKPAVEEAIKTLLSKKSI